MSITYGQAELGSLHAVARKYGTSRLNGKDEGRVKHIHALVLQSLQRHQQNGESVPKAVVYNEVRNAIRRSGRYGNPLLILIMPFLIQFLQQMLPVIMDYILGLLNDLTKQEQVAQLNLLAGSAKQLWSLDN